MSSNFLLVRIFSFICFFFIRGILADGVVQITGTTGTAPSFLPINVNAAIGQTISFRFFTNATTNYTITEGIFEKPCNAKPGGFSSGNITGYADPENPDFYFYNFIVATSAPFYYFSSVAKCVQGMTGGINTPSNNAVFYREKALAIDSTFSETTTTTTRSGYSFGFSITIIIIPVVAVVVIACIVAFWFYNRHRRRARQALYVEAKQNNHYGSESVQLTSNFR